MRAVFLTVALGALVHGRPAPSDDGFVDLFDGKSLAGWQRFGGKAEAWEVDGETLISVGEGGGWLGTHRDYDNFVLRLDFRLSPGANSGIYLRAPADTSHISRTGMEIQILDDDHPRYKGIKPWQLTGSIYHVAAAESGHLKPTGEWNALQIRALGPQIVVTLNGAKIVDDQIDKHPELEKEHSGLLRKSGRIGLQSHDGRVEFRRLQIQKIGNG
jgi:hypothetical protein